MPGGVSGGAWRHRLITGDTSPLTGLLPGNCGSSPGTGKSRTDSAHQHGPVPEQEPGSAGGVRRSGDFAEEGVDGAEERLLITAGELVEALEAPEEPPVGRGRAACSAR